jgi:hypothetical protein
MKAQKRDKKQANFGDQEKDKVDLGRDRGRIRGRIKGRKRIR